MKQLPRGEQRLLGEHSDAELYDLLMAEYPGWVKGARQRGLPG